MTEQESDTRGIENRLNSIELRLNRLEEVLENQVNGRSYSYGNIEKPDSSTLVSTQPDEGKGLESRIGRLGLASLGNIVLFFAISFLTQYLTILGQALISAILGYSAVIAIFFLARYMKKSNEHLAFMFKINGQILLFYLTMRLHFFSATPLIQQKYLCVGLLFLIIGYQVYWAIRNQSQTLSVISVVLALTTALCTDTTHIMLPLTTITAAASVYYYYRFRWQPLVLITIFLTYLTFFLWLFGNPLPGNHMDMPTGQHKGIIYLFLLAGCYSSLLLLRKKESSSDNFFEGMTFANGILFTCLLILTVFRFFKTEYVPLFVIITVCCLIFAIILHSKSDWNFASAFYSLYGFMAMSIALYGLFGLPKIYLLLPFQSLIVVSLALWFRNRLIVVMNSLLFLSILLVYLISPKSIDSVNFSFALIALISARVINWQKSRLKIKTDYIRNLYLIEGFIMVLLAFYHAMPKQFITLSWIMAALLYFLLSLLLKNVKYRYMALGTMICAAIYLFLVDLSSIEIIYRVLALMFLSAISIGISMYYSSRIKKAEN